MRLAVVADFRSIHARRWVEFFAGHGHVVLAVSASYVAHPPAPGVQVVNLGSRHLRDVLRALEMESAAMGLRRAFGALLPADAVERRLRFACGPAERRRIRAALQAVDQSSLHLAQALDQFCPHVVQPLRLVGEGILGSTYTRLPVVQAAWGQDVNYYPDRYPELRPLLQRALGGCAGYLCDAATDLEDARTMGLPSSVPVMVVPGAGGVDLPAIDKARQDLPRPAAFGDEPVFMSFRGTGRPATDNAPVVRALRILRGRLNLPARLVIYGERHGPFYDYLRHIAIQEGVWRHVAVKPPFQYDQLAATVSRYRYVFSPAVRDGTSNALLEAMALGCIPLVSGLPQNRAWVEDGTNGYVFDLSSPEEIAEVFARAHRERERHGDIARYNRKLIEARANRAVIMRAVESFLEHAAGRP